MVAVENTCMLVETSEEERENAREGCAEKQALRESRIKRKGAVPLQEKGRKVFCMSHEELKRSPMAGRKRQMAAVNVCECQHLL